MKLAKGTIFFPENRKTGRVKYMAFVAHAGDAEMMAIDGICRGYRARKYPFSCIVTCNDNDLFEGKENIEALKETRMNEQKAASELGRYNSCFFLNYDASQVKDPCDEEIVKEIAHIIKYLKPRVIYTHSLLDRDFTNVAVAIKVIYAIRSINRGAQPKVIYGCEHSRDLDWINKNKVVEFNNSKNIRFQRKLVACFETKGDSKRPLPKAVIARRVANATFSEKGDNSFRLVSRAINMTNVARNSNLPVRKFAMSFVDDLYGDILEGLERNL